MPREFESSDIQVEIFHHGVSFAVFDVEAGSTLETYLEITVLAPAVTESQPGRETLGKISIEIRNHRDISIEIKKDDGVNCLIFSSESLINGDLRIGGHFGLGAVISLL